MNDGTGVTESVNRHRRVDHRRCRVLVVDDDQLVRDILVGALADEGYDVDAASNGREALDRLDTWQPDVILLDLMMPEMDGWTFRARQLSHVHHAGIPVIVLSAAPNLRYGVDTLRATAIFPKPFDLDLLLAAVNAVA